MPPPINSRHSKYNSAPAVDDPGDCYYPTAIGMTGFATDLTVTSAPDTYWQSSKSCERCQYVSGADASQAFASNRIPAAACSIHSRRPQSPSLEGFPSSPSDQDFTRLPFSGHARESVQPTRSGASGDDDLSWVGSGLAPTQGQWAYFIQSSVPYNMVGNTMPVLRPHPSPLPIHNLRPTFEGGFIDPRLLALPSHLPQSPSPTFTSFDSETSPSLSPSTTVASPHCSPLIAHGCPDPPAVAQARSHKPYMDQLSVWHLQHSIPASPVEGSSSTWKDLCRCPLKVNFERKHWTRTCPYNPNRKKHSCPNCGESFSRKDNMARHMKQGCDPKSSV